MIISLIYSGLVGLVAQSCLIANTWTVAQQALLSMGFPRQESWCGLPFPSPGDLPDPGIKPGYSSSQADSLPSEPPGKPKSKYRCNESTLTSSDNVMHTVGAQ